MNFRVTGGSDPFWGCFGPGVAQEMPKNLKKWHFYVFFTFLVVFSCKLLGKSVLYVAANRAALILVARCGSHQNDNLKDMSKDNPRCETTPRLSVTT